MIVDGKSIAADILASVKKEMITHGLTPVVRAVNVCPTKATESYLKIKAAKAGEAGMRLEVERLHDDASTEEVVQAVRVPGADAVIVQLPLPVSIQQKEVCDALPVQKDADVLSSVAYEAFVKGEEHALLPPVVAAIVEVLSRAGIDPNGMNVAVVGGGVLVGKPAAVELERLGAKVTVFRKGDDLTALREADIVVSGAGVPGLITPTYLRQGVVLIDAGTSESAGALAGDMDPACADVAAVFTPVPGGVGPVAVACLFRNVAKLVSSR